MTSESNTSGTGPSASGPTAQEVTQHIVEFVCDSGEGAQTAGQMFGTLCAKMGNGVWTVEIIPAEIEPPVRSRHGASGNRIRVGTEKVTNMGDEADMVVAFNEQVLYSRIDVGALRPGTVIFLESKWAQDPDAGVQKEYSEALKDFDRLGYQVIETPMEIECLKIVSDARRGKNMWALGMLAAVYDLDIARVRDDISRKFAKKGQAIIDNNAALMESGYIWGSQNIPFRYHIPVEPSDQPMITVNGNLAVSLGIMAAGIELCSMYPITPATSVSHYLAAAFPGVGGFIHQAEDEIAAIGFALGAAYAGKTPVTVTSGPGMALKTEFIGLAVMAELPLVIVNVQRGGPSTGLPTKVEQGDLLSSIFGSPSDAPKVVMAASTIEECFEFVVTARKLAETFRTPVIVLTDANLATGQQNIPRPELSEDWLSPPVDQSDWEEGVPAFNWDPETGLSQRPIPGQRDGMYTLTGLAHDERSKVAYESAVNQRAMEARSRKLATLANSLQPPRIYGGERGDLLVVGWGSTRGAIEEAVDRIRADGQRVSSVHLRFLSPMEPGLKDIFANFKKVMTVEINYSDSWGNPQINPESRRTGQLAWLLRARTLVDVDCWSRVPGNPVPPGMIERELRKRLNGTA